jgi:hypothetical protein
MKKILSFLSDLFKKKSSRQKALETLNSLNGFYNDIKTIISSIEDPKILDLPINAVIFNKGDKPDNVYLVLEGGVKLIFSKNTPNSDIELVVHKGEFFGELGVLSNSPRVATAIAQNNLRLIVIEGETFKKHLSEYPLLQQMVSQQQLVYKIPMIGLVEQYFGDVSGLGPTITSIYKMDKNRSIISSKALKQDIFVMSTVKLTPLVETRYKYQSAQNKIELRTHDKRLTSIKVSGTWESLPTACQLMLDNTIIEVSILKNFELSGEIESHISSEIICECFSVKKSDLIKLINEGMKDLCSLSKTTGAATACRRCEGGIVNLLKQNV